jgi:hypothetical protein
VVASWVVFQLKPWWAPMLGVWKSNGVPKHKNHKQESRIESARVTKSGETKNLRKPKHTLKVVNTFTRALAPPFIGRRRDCYLPRLPSNLRNIPNVNTHMKAFTSRDLRG